MPIKEIVSDAKIEYAINSDDKKVLTLQEIANAPHHYSHKKLLCVKCHEELTVVNGHTGFFLRHLNSSGDAHFACELYTAGRDLLPVYQLRNDFIAKREIELNYILVIENDSIKFYATLPPIKPKLKETLKATDGCIKLKHQSGFRVLKADDLNANKPTIVKINDEINVSHLIFKIDDRVAKYEVGWFYKKALFTYKKIDNTIYMNKIVFEINSECEYMFISDKEKELVKGTTMTCIRKLRHKNEIMYLHKMKITKYSDELDEFLIEHDCSYTIKSVNRNKVFHNKIINYESENNTSNEAIKETKPKSETKVTLWKDNSKFYPYLGYQVLSMTNGKGIVEELKIVDGKISGIYVKINDSSETKLFGVNNVEFLGPSKKINKILKGRKIWVNSNEYKIGSYTNNKIYDINSKLISEYPNKEIIITLEEKNDKIVQSQVPIINKEEEDLKKNPTKIINNIVVYKKVLYKIVGLIEKNGRLNVKLWDTKNQIEVAYDKNFLINLDLARIMSFNDDLKGKLNLLKKYFIFIDIKYIKIENVDQKNTIKNPLGNWNLVTKIFNSLGKKKPGQCIHKKDEFNNNYLYLFMKYKFPGKNKKQVSTKKKNTKENKIKKVKKEDVKASKVKENIVMKESEKMSDTSIGSIFSDYFKKIE